MTSVPVSALSGMHSATAVPYDTLSTRILNMTEYIACGAMYEYSVTFSHSYYDSCVSDSGNATLRVCTTGLPALRHISNKQCVTALFEGNARYIERLSTVVYAKQHEYSTAQYIYINNTATLATESGRLANDVWRMGCMHPSKGTITRTTIRPCLLCHISIRCYCTLYGNDFDVPMRLHNCRMYTPSSSTMDIRQHFNMIVAIVPCAFVHGWIRRVYWITECLL